ncbi:MAG TPA: class I SAM-dependent methyltransferase [Vicinamibacterales bacterium]|nr:class I SAM-dependent methyltransferase [Vicinamibacterales bacterium]
MTPTLATAGHAPSAGIATEAVPRCPACGSDRRHLRTHITEHEYTTTTTDAFPLMACDGCGAWYLDPRPHVSALGVIYPPDYYAYVRDALEAPRDPVVHAGSTGTRPTGTGSEATPPASGLFARLGSALFKRRIRPITKYIELGPATRWLDVGCGSGSVLQSMQDAYGLSGTGIDLSSKAVEVCRRRGFTAHAVRFEDYVPGDGEAYDLIHSSHLIEHLESPFAYLRKTWDLLAPGGLSVFITPNTATWEAGAFGRHWGGMHAPRHWTLLDEASTLRLAERAGFEHVATSFSTNGTFWTWTCHSLLTGRIPTRVNDALFPSDSRFIRNTLWNVARIGAFSLLDAANVAITRRSSNMLVILRKPAGAAPRGVTP